MSSAAPDSSAEAASISDEWPEAGVNLMHTRCQLVSVISGDCAERVMLERSRRSRESLMGVAAIE